jgi:hypothetical protein
VPINDCDRLGPREASTFCGDSQPPSAVRFWTLFMNISDLFPTNYAANAVACKLWGHVASPTELILGQAVFNKLDEQPGWKCWVYSVDEYRQKVVEATDVEPALFALVPQLPISEVGDVDFAIFIPSISKRRPVVIIECDGHQFHERTVEQASNDRRRTACSRVTASPY